MLKMISADGSKELCRSSNIPFTIYSSPAQVNGFPIASSPIFAARLPEIKTDLRSDSNDGEPCDKLISKNVKKSWLTAIPKALSVLSPTDIALFPLTKTCAYLSISGTASINSCPKPIVVSNDSSTGQTA